MEALNKILKEVLDDLTPAKKVEKELSGIIIALNKALKADRIKAVCVLGGSVAKNTFLANEYDVDLFVRFDYSYKDKNISAMLEKALKRISPKAERVHGSRDYFHLKDSRYGDFSYELVPVLDIRDPKKAVNVTDMSPLHVSWVKKNSKLDTGKKAGKKKGKSGGAKAADLTDDIRLAKAFCKAAGVYGAESFIKGFSGHVLDIIVIYYHGFMKLLKASQKWKDKEVIDFYNKYKGRAYMMMNKSKLQSPIAVVDPVLPERNAAAALSKEKLDIFVKRASQFLKKPSKDFFKRIDKNPAYYKRMAGDDMLILLEAKLLDGTEDVRGTKALKAFEYLDAQLAENDFIVKKADWSWDGYSDNALLCFIMDKRPLSDTFIRDGPPLKAKRNADDFRKAHLKDKVFEKKDRLFAEMKRPYRKADDFVKDLLKGGYLKDRLKSVKMLDI